MGKRIKSLPFNSRPFFFFASLRSTHHPSHPPNTHSRDKRIIHDIRPSTITHTLSLSVKLPKQSQDEQPKPRRCRWRPGLPRQSLQCRCQEVRRCTRSEDCWKSCYEREDCMYLTRLHSSISNAPIVLCVCVWVCVCVRERVCVCERKRES